MVSLLSSVSGSTRLGWLLTVEGSSTYLVLAPSTPSESGIYEAGEFIKNTNGIAVVFKGPVHRTEKKTETGLNRTD
jgi:hypothetical protein